MTVKALMSVRRNLVAPLTLDAGHNYFLDCNTSA
jgi:hypothetical protein